MALAASCTSDDDGESFATSFSVLGGLAELPQSGDPDRSLTIEIVDYAAASAAVDLDILTPNSSTDDIVDWVVATGNPTPLAEGGNGLALSIPQLIPGRAVAVDGAIENEFGWTFGSISHYAEANAFPDRFTVLAGDLTWVDGLAEVAPDVRTIGDGEDGEFSTDGPTELRPFAQPLRVSERPGLVAASPDTPPIEAWATETQDSYAGVPELAAIATALDDREVFQALLLRASFGIGDSLVDSDARNAQQIIERLIDEPFSALGLGVAGSGDDLRYVVVYAFATPESAAAAAPQLETMWTSGRSLIDERPFTELIAGPTIAQDERLVIVTGSAPATAQGFATRAALAQGDVPFYHR